MDLSPTTFSNQSPVESIVFVLLQKVTSSASTPPYPSSPFSVQLEEILAPSSPLPKESSKDSLVCTDSCEEIDGHAPKSDCLDNSIDLNTAEKEVWPWDYAVVNEDVGVDLESSCWLVDREQA